MLSAAVRDLHRSHPGRFLTDVRTRCAALWEHNPFLTPLADHDPEAERIECEYPLINEANTLPYHCLHGFRKFLEDRLGVAIEPQAFHGDIHLAPEEKAWMSQVHELTGRAIPFWVVVAGGKFDVDIKWWESARYQAVVDHFRGRVQFVQVGQRGHHHPALRGVIDLRGRTDLRQLVRLIHHAQGVLCPVTCAMHLAAAVETRPGRARCRPCVVIAGGREPAHWEAYPGHQFLHTIGGLSCCAAGGCWKASIHPDPNANDGRPNHCVEVRGALPRCMDMIQPAQVIRAIETYFEGGAARYLAEGDFEAAQTAVAKTAEKPGSALTVFTARQAAEEFIRKMEPAPEHYEGRGIVIPGGGRRYLACAWVNIRMLRQLGVQLPIEIWHLGPEEMPAAFADLVQPLGVRCVDARALQKRIPARRLNGWELKAYALLHSCFREVLLLDADNVPVRNPEELFETPEYRETGALFWPDYGRLSPRRSIWTLCGVPYADEPEFESGQIVADKSRCWRALRLALWYNEHSDFFYGHIHGDKDTFHLAFRKLRVPYAMPATPIHSLEGVMCQHDFAGRRMFQHRNSHKWTLAGGNRRIEGFLFEEECLASLEALRASGAVEPAAAG